THRCFRNPTPGNNLRNINPSENTRCYSQGRLVPRYRGISSSPQNSECQVSFSSAARALSPQPDPIDAVYVHLMSGEIATISPATSVVVQSHTVVVFNGVQAVAAYPRRDVFCCSKTEISPTL